ncbi:TlpA family protein disulfide reductase [Ectothiorhodospiraceae bacterium WFHF3C12]|nr:TlpA family protein disulfide reductase [Ectothiorhodospiraceae bacterium WFHF3C12]
MDTLQLGPFALPLDRLPGIAALFALLLVGALVSRDRPRLRAWSTEAALLGLLSARLAFVALHWPAYEDHPLSVLYIWQGGFNALAGAAAVLPYTFWRLRPDPDSLLRAGIPLVAAALAFAAGMAAALGLKPAERPVPDLTLSTLDGREDSLRGHLGQPLIINLWATWCPPCRREMPMLVDLAAEREDVTVLLVNQGESAQQIRQFLDEVGLDGNAIRLDPRNRTSETLQVTAYPTTLIYDAGGNLVVRQAGEVSRAAMEQGIVAAQRAGE